MIRDELLNDIASATWNMQATAFFSRLPLVYDIITKAGKPEGSDWSAEREKNKATILEIRSGNGDSANVQKVGVVYLRGVVTKYDQYSGARGTRSIAKQVKEFDKDPEYAGTIIQIDSPGGASNAHSLLEREIISCEKPVLAHVEGMAASAAYGIAASCREILISDKTDLLGSIGTLMSWFDAVPFFKSQGYDYYEFYSRLSPQKNKEFRDLTEGKEGAEELLLDYIDTFAKAFIDSVKSYRGDKINKDYQKDIFEGKDYLGDEALKAGLADGYGTLQDAANRVVQLNNQKNMSNSKLSNIMSFFGKNESEQEANLQKLDEALADKKTAENRVQELTQQLEASQAEKETSDSRIDDLLKTNETLTNKVAELEAKLDNTPENNGTEVVPEGDAGGESKNANKPWAKTPWMQQAVAKFESINPPKK